MINYDKAEVRQALNIDNIFQLLEEWGGEPEFTNFGIISTTICHNRPGEGSRKLYYYSNTDLFQCYTGCDDPSFDIFGLMIKVHKNQKSMDLDLNDAIRYIAFKFGIVGNKVEEDTINSVLDWQVLNNYERIENITIKDYHITLKEYEPTILDRLNYSVRLAPWLNEGISQEAMDLAHIGFYPGAD
jgi:hypothetical protein